MIRTKSEKLTLKEAELKQLENEIKKLKQGIKSDEREAHNKCVYNIGELMMNLLPEIKSLTDEQRKTFLETTVLSSFARRKLDSIMNQNSESISTEKAKSATATTESTTAQKEKHTADSVKSDITDKAKDSTETEPPASSNNNSNAQTG